MRFLTRVTLETETANNLVRNPEFRSKLDAIFAEIRPESVYFCVEGGRRTLYALVDVANNSDLPRIAEPFWLGLKAGVEFIPAMTKEDFAKAAPGIEQSVRKFSWA